MKVDQASLAEPHPSQINANSSSTTALAGNSKMSKFGMKSGFVIPKNKLSGSLVPILRGATKVETDTVTEESNKQIQRKTKWGTDLTQDASVRRGRALAYQTRVEQITTQLKLGVLGKENEDLSSLSPKKIPTDESSRTQADDQLQKLEMLELEKRETIGEILKLNPSYKAPLDYKPLMKETSVPVPIKLYPGLNFVGLILGPGGNTQKHLEEETGARIRIQGTKAGSTEKVEITLSDKNDVQSAYEELVVNVSADTLEKVDAAVSLIELLVTPVSGTSAVVSTAPSSVSGDSANVIEQSQDATSNLAMHGHVINQGVMQSMVGPMQSGFHPQVQFHTYPPPWFPAAPLHPSSNFGPTPNSTAPMPNSVVHYPSSPLNPSRMPQFLGGYPSSAAGSVLAPRNPSHSSPGLHAPMQGFQWPYFRGAPPNNQAPPMRMHPISGSQPHSAYPPPQTNLTAPHQGMINQPRMTGPGLGAAHVSQSQPMSNAPYGQAPNLQFASSGWSTSSVPTASQPVHLQRPPVLSQPPMTPGSAPNAPATVISGPSGNMASAGFHPRPSISQLSNTLINHSVTGPNFSFVVHQSSPLASTPVPPAAVASRLAFLHSSAPPSTLLPSSMMPPSPSTPSALPRVPAPAPAPAPAQAQALAQALAFNQSSPASHMQPVGPQRPAPSQSMVGAASPLSSASPQISVSPNSVSGGFTSPNPATSGQQSIPSTAKLQRPTSGDFTFQPLGSPLPVCQTVPRPSHQPSQLPSQPQKTAMQSPLAPHTPSFRPAVQNSGSQIAMQGFPSSRPSSQSVQFQSQVPPPSPIAAASFSGNPSPFRPPPRFQEYTNPNPVPNTGSAHHMRPQNFMQESQMSNFPGRFPPQTISRPQLMQNRPTSTIRPGSFSVPNQHFGNNPTHPGRLASSPSGNQVYDPFSPTSVSAQQVENPAKVRKQEDDPEYDDLMESVGVR